MNRPWFRPMVTEFLETFILHPDMAAFEWGMGGSTMWLAGRVRQVVSVEHDKQWYDAIPKKKNSRRLLIFPQRGIIKPSPSLPEAYFSADKRWRDYNFREYASAIDSFGLFDLVIVDGRARPSCLLHGHSHVVAGGFLVLDDTNREYYLRHTIYLFDGWDRFTFFENEKETTIWRKTR